MADLEYSVRDHIATIRLNRPEQKNAFTLDMIDAWAEALYAAEANPEVRVVVLTGAGGAFCSGVDLSVLQEIEQTPLASKELLTKHVHKVALAVETMSKPYLAAVAGPAIGAGMDMALLADIRVAADTARFSQAYVRVGLVPGDGGCYLLPRIVGTATALRLLWTGETLDAQRAMDIGLISTVCSEDELEATVYALARSIAGQPPVAVQMIKRSVRFGETHDLRTALDLISSHNAIVLSTDDSREARAALAERRPPIYHGR